MFRITEDPSSFVQCLDKNYKNDSILSVDMNMVGVMAAYCDRFVCSSLYMKTITPTMSMSTDTIESFL